MDRTDATIRADWRAATDQREDLTFNPDLEARIEVLRLEHVAAIEATAAGRVAFARYPDAWPAPSPIRSSTFLARGRPWFTGPG